MSTDTYTALVNQPLGRRLAASLGLPQPALLRRYRPGQELVEGSVLVLGRGPVAEAAATVLLDWDQDVRRHPAPGDRYGAVVACFDDVATPADLSATALVLGSVQRQLGPSARVVTVLRDPAAAADPAVRAARQGVEGLTRSLAHEMRRGATANGLVLGEEVAAGAPGAVGALRFLLSARSAFVSGQFLAVGSPAGALPRDWAQPLSGRVAVVTGAARGIGAAIARTLHRDGATVVGVDVPAAGQALADVANEVRGTALQLDITAPDAGERLLAHCRDRHGRLDIMVHNAGITRDRKLANMDAGQWDPVIAVNIEAQLAINRVLLAAGPDVVPGPLRIAALASTSGIAGNAGQANYAASKAGVMGMVAATAPLLQGRGTVNAVAPGLIETEMTARMPLARREAGRRLNSLAQGGRPEDVAEAVAFLVSDSAGGTTGTTLRVCGQGFMGA
ncbi:3-oxoacyl-ACP reductase [Citricoccus sp. SGAir0253]|uniref:3-oxoacyl-ACP reductase n=1 Tax=Citricoccus sp. SGAir0253 TaxID=2567881 RepID=UPI0010CCBF0C|nr:3-oxoacyl-ACP reductase [Citricoccus sp. SGAir0253]QCU78073.1 3-oxoacyl-ACP reductase [Citricoccus sp. SGAir0253]